MKIAIDMDGTIANFTEASFKKVEELYGIKMTVADAYKPKTAQLVWERMSEEQKSKYKDCNELYGEICDKGFFLTIKPFEHAIESVKEIFSMGYQIFFLTKILNWDRSANEKAIWLEKYFSDIDYKIIMVDSVHSKHIVNADVFIDDDPRVLKGVSGFSICMARPWNEKVREESYIGEVVTDMKEAVEILKRIKPAYDWWDKDILCDIEI